MYPMDFLLPSRKLSGKRPYFCDIVIVDDIVLDVKKMRQLKSVGAEQAMSR
jgi:hypothetical protein